MLTSDSRGSITVETALIMPLILGVIFGLICTASFIHDRGVICGKADELAIDKITDKEQAKKNIESDMWMMNIQNITISRTRLSYKVKISAGMRIRDPLSAMFLRKRMNFTISRKADLIQPEIIVEIRDKSNDNMKGGDDEDEDP